MAFQAFARFSAAAAVALSMAPLASVASAAPADDAAGQYAGAITADQKGQPKQGVTIIVERAGDNEVKVNCDCARIPARTFTIAYVGDALKGTNGQDTFKMEAAKLELRIDGASFSGAPDDDAGGVTAPN